MIVDCLLDVTCAAVAYFDCVAVEYFPERVLVGKTLVYQGEEFLSDVCLHAFTKRRVVPQDILSWSVPASARSRWLKFEGAVVAACVQRSLVGGGGAASSKDSRSDDIEESRLLIPAGMFLIIEGGGVVALSVHVQQGGVGFRVRDVSAFWEVECYV